MLLPEGLLREHIGPVFRLKWHAEAIFALSKRSTLWSLDVDGSSEEAPLCLMLISLSLF